MAGDVGSSMGIGGSGGIFSRKTELVADLTSAFKSLNSELKKTRDLSAEISRNLKTARGGGGDLFDSSSRSSGTKDPSQNDGSQNGGNGGFGLSNALSIAGKAAGFAFAAMPTLQNVFAQNLSSSQAGFQGLQNGTNAQRLAYGSAQQNYLGTQGSFGSTEELYKAQRLMTQYGMQGTNSPVFQANVAAMSNLVPGSNSAAVGAVQALNSGKSVNMARMIGINIRGANGFMRDIPSIANDLWDYLKKAYTGTHGTPSKSDIDYSIQPGNILDSVLNQYFGTDPVLRQGVLTEIYSKAGGASTKAATTKQGAQNLGITTQAANSVTNKTAAQARNEAAFSKYELQGMVDANQALTDINNKMANIISGTNAWAKALQEAAKVKGGLDTLSTAGNGTGGSIMSSLINGAGLLGSFLLGKAKGAGKAVTDVAARAVPTLEEAGLTAIEGASIAAEEATGAATSPFSAGASLVATTAASYGTWKLIENLKKKIKPKGGDDTSNSSNVATSMSRPLAGNPQITSGFGEVRNILNASGQKIASYGKPHGGVDFGVSEGTPVYAVKDGQVSALSDPSGFGNYASLDQADGKTSIYGHLSRLQVGSGQKVRAGDVIGYSGNSGNSTGPHLHFEMRDGANKIDPLNYLNGATSSPDSSGGATAHPLYGGLHLSNDANGGLSLSKGGEGNTSATVNGMVNNGNSGYGSSINYGGVNIAMHFPEGTYNKEEIKNAVREVISYDNIRKHAVSK